MSLSHLTLSCTKSSHRLGLLPPDICASIQAVTSSLIYSLFASSNVTANGLAVYVTPVIFLVCPESLTVALTVVHPVPASVNVGCVNTPSPM